MYNYCSSNQLSFEDFLSPFGGQLRSDNRWVMLSKQIPWDDIEQTYAANFSSNKSGNVAKSVRIALGSLVIKERLGTTDRETVLHIAENPYLQYFLGFSTYNDEVPFDHSLMTYFRKRFDQGGLSIINELMIKEATCETESTSTDKSHTILDSNDKTSNLSNKGNLIVDATCTPADITFPTDLKLLNNAREKSEKIIDTMHVSLIGKRRKPKTNRKQARRDYLEVAKQKKPGNKKYYIANGKQLKYIKQNLESINTMAKEGRLVSLSKKQYRDLLVINELYRQQKFMHDGCVNSITDRITSISQPHVRPVIRGKAKQKVEFGAKVSISLVDGFSYVDKISWDNYNESGDLVGQIQSFKKRFGHYPEAVLADQIYRTRFNRQYCKDRSIRLSGAPLGRPKKITAENKDEIKQLKKQRYQDEINRIPVEGKFGQAKRRFSLGLVMSKLTKTSETTIMIAFIVMNLEKILKDISFCANILLQSFQCAMRYMKRIECKGSLSIIFNFVNKTQPVI